LAVMVRCSGPRRSPRVEACWNSPANPAGSLLYMIGKEWNK
jgi:hypothetical protein